MCVRVFVAVCLCGCVRVEGLAEMVKPEWLTCFDERELEVLLCGMEEIDVDDWERSAAYKGGYGPTCQTVIWFWKFVRELDHEKRARLLQFVTGTCRVPVGGFGQLTGLLSSPLSPSPILYPFS